MKIEKPVFGRPIIAPFKDGQMIHASAAKDRSKAVMASYQTPHGYPRELANPENHREKIGERHSISVREESSDGLWKRTYLAVDVAPKGDIIEVTVGPKPASISGSGPVTEHEIKAVHSMMKERGFEPAGEPAHREAPKGEKGSAMIKYRRIR